MKHAWLVIAHNEFEILQLLLDALDGPEDDIFVHIDKKVRVLPLLRPRKSTLRVLENRLDVRWGNVSQIQCELALMEEAQKYGPYGYYHIISGTHLPLQNKETIHAFYESHKGHELMNLWEEDPRDIGNKLARYNFFTRQFTNPHPGLKKLAQFSWRVTQFVQKKLRVNRFPSESFRKSDNWVSLTEGAVRFLVSRKDEILRKYRFTYCGDEYFVATELMQRPDLFQIKDCKTMLKVIFKRHNPEVLTVADFDFLLEGGFMFGRKFSARHMDVVFRILHHNAYV